MPTQISTSNPTTSISSPTTSSFISTSLSSIAYTSADSGLGSESKQSKSIQTARLTGAVIGVGSTVFIFFICLIVFIVYSKRKKKANDVLAQKEIIMSNTNPPRRTTISLYEKEGARDDGNSVMKGTKTIQGPALDENVQKVIEDIIISDLANADDIASKALPDVPALSNEAEGEETAIEGEGPTPGNDEREEDSIELREIATTISEDKDLLEFLKEIGLQQYYDKMCKHGWTLNRLLDSYDGTFQSMEQLKTAMNKNFHMPLRERIHLSASIKNKKIQISQEEENL
ncbi:hypothetical protein RFI_03884 [Reticulomyxa filosa]|uniref:SAM domain-containing protein n=1 Tax=Reticulomyxa filosa TaxID=46433 RepID=X6P6H7_RETFI|nr:hypothetical protein RFI_03884 [Reticulomyxa filosa]|eukprot:ETO33222.1 hypothetical protein RFI_03884 [Reticulomyxa filosa]